jgi:hypothetical protein
MEPVFAFLAHLICISMLGPAHALTSAIDLDSSSVPPMEPAFHAQI